MWSICSWWSKCNDNYTLFLSLFASLLFRWIQVAKTRMCVQCVAAGNEHRGDTMKWACMQRIGNRVCSTTNSQNIRSLIQRVSAQLLNVRSGFRLQSYKMKCNVLKIDGNMFSMNKRRYAVCRARTASQPQLCAFEWARSNGYRIRFHRYSKSK